MAYEITATKFRPQTFDELIGQEFVAATLKNSIQNKRIANAYLLSGPRGVGKTSAARIIAKALNCNEGPTETPCNKCDNCKTITHGYNSDVIEVDGASNTGINDVRIIQEEILYPPVNSKYKVYIIDEVHMLSKNAFNALLKTIEEPPKYVVFIFATTEINKVLATIRSRCQQFNFRLIPSNFIFNCLVKILKEYNVKYKDDAIIWIANEGKGSMRDSYTLLDQVISFCDNNITLKKIQETLALVGEEKMSRMIHGLIKKHRETIFTEYFSMLESGISPEQIITEMIGFFRNILMIKSNLADNKFIGFNPELYDKELISSFTFEDIENILEILFQTYEKSKFSIDIQTEIEVCLLKLLKYKDLIRPKQIISELNSLKSSLVNNQFKTNIADIDTQNTNTKAYNTIKKDSIHPHINIKIEADKSEILKIIKSKLSSSHFQLLTALNNISFIEEKENHMFLYFTHRMHYDIAKNHEDFLTQEALAIIGEKYNKNFKIVVEYKQEEKEQTIQGTNKMKIKNIFQGQEI